MPFSISIDRAAKKFAAFDPHWNLLSGEFKPYATEDEAVAAASKIIARHTDEAPTIVYPRVRSMRTYSK